MKEGARSKFIGEYLQFHLNRLRLLSHEEYIAARDKLPVQVVYKGRKREVIVSAGARDRPRRLAKPKSAKDIEFEKTLLALENGGKA
jgi:hypothetical protein